MQNFDNVEDLVSYMFENVDNEDNRISVIVNRDITVDALKELLNYENIVLSICDIDCEADYDREYIISLFDDVDSDDWYVSIEKAYLEEKEKYISIDGYVLFHEDVNSKAMIDMQNNEFLPLGEHDWFTVGEHIDEDNTDEDEVTDEDPDTELSSKVKEVCRVNGKEVDKDTYLKIIDKINRDIDKDMNREFSDMIDWLYRPYLCEYRPRPIRFYW